MSTKQKGFEALSWPWNVFVIGVLTVAFVAVGLMPRPVQAIVLFGVFLASILFGLGTMVYWFVRIRRIEREYLVRRDDPELEPSAAASAPFSATAYGTTPSSPAFHRRRMAIVCLGVGSVVAGLLAGEIVFDQPGPIRAQFVRDVFALTFFGLNLGALYGVAHERTWGRWYGTVAGIVWCFTCIGIALGIPMLIGLRRLPAMTWLGSETRS
jgi:hypothetical protein